MFVFERKCWGLVVNSQSSCSCYHNIGFQGFGVRGQALIPSSCLCCLNMRVICKVMNW